MRRPLVVALLVCLPRLATGQDFIRYYPPSLAITGSVPSGFRIFVPNQTDFPGSMAIGTGGANLINSGPFSHTGEGSEFFGLEAGDANTDAAFNTFVGYRAGKRATTGSQNTFLGMAAGEYMVTGTGNTYLGAFSGQNSTGDYNVVIGTDAGNEMTSAQDSVIVGRAAAGLLQTGNGNTYIGADAGATNVSSTGNTCVGMFCLLLGTGSNNVALGYTAGRWETGNYKLFIDGYSRNDEADARAKSLIYGVMGANVADQTLYVNGFLNPAGQLRAAGGSGAAPGISFAGDATSGLTLAAPGVVDISVAGVSRFRVGASFNPLADISYDLGSPSNRYRYFYIGTAIQGSSAKALSGGSATTFVRVAVPQTAAANYGGGSVGYTVYASDGTDSQSLVGDVRFAMVNKAGAETCAIGEVGTPVLAQSTGSTLTCTFACATAAADTVDISANCASGLVETTFTINFRADMQQPNSYAVQ